MKYVCDLHSKFLYGFRYYIWKEEANFVSYEKTIEKYFEKLKIWDFDSFWEKQYYFRFSDGKCFKLTHDASWVYCEVDDENHVDNYFYISECDENQCNYLPKTERDWI